MTLVVLGTLFGRARKGSSTGTRHLVVRFRDMAAQSSWVIPTPLNMELGEGGDPWTCMKGPIFLLWARAEPWLLGS